MKFMNGWRSPGCCVTPIADQFQGVCLRVMGAAKEGHCDSQRKEGRVGAVIVPEPAGAAMRSGANSNTRMLIGQRP